MAVVTDAGGFADHCLHCGGTDFEPVAYGLNVLEMPDGRIIGGLRRCANPDCPLKPSNQDPFADEEAPAQPTLNGC